MQILFGIAQDEVEAGLYGDGQIGALDFFAHGLGHAEGKISQADGQVEALEIGVGADAFHGIEAHVDQAVGVGADGGEAGIDDDLVVGAVGFFAEHVDELEGGVVDIVGTEALAGGAVSIEFFGGHADHQRVVIFHEGEHVIELGARGGDGIENRLAAFGAVIELEAALVEFDGGIVEGEGHAGDFLNRGDKVRQEIEHLLRAHHHGLGAVDVERDIVRLHVGLEFSEFFESR